MADWPYNTTAWQRVRSLKLSTTPMCEPCEARGRHVPANTVDHITSITRGGEPFPPLSGLMSMCHICHNTKTNAVDRAGGKGVRFKGCGPDGFPIDPEHPAYQGSTPSKDQQSAAPDRRPPPLSTKFRRGRR